MLKRKILDAELLDRDLLVADAYDREGLVCRRLTEDATVLEPIAFYIHARYDQGEKVFCCICGVRKHKRGYWARCSDETVRPLGNCCAKPRLGRNWMQSQHAFKDMERRKGYLLKLRDACPDILRARARLPSWGALGQELKVRQRAFFGAMPEVYELVVQAAKRDGILEATERVKNIHWDPKKPADERKWNYLPQNHPIAGRSFLRFTDSHDVISVVERAISSFSSVAENTDNCTTKQLRKAFSDIECARLQLARLGEMADAYSSFFRDDNLNGIVRWSHLVCENHDRRLRRPIARSASGLLNRETGAAFEFVQLPQPDLGVIQLLAA